MKSVSVFAITFMSLIFASFLAFTISFAAEWAFVDLKPFANSKIDNVQWWTGNPGATDFDELPKGVNKLDGPGGTKVPFKIENACLVVWGSNTPQRPESIKGIKVQMKAATIYFLHMTGWQAGDGQAGYKFVINYRDGSSEEFPIKTHENSDDWCHIPPQLRDKRSAMAWKEPGVTCGTVALYATKWDNPKKGTWIETIDFVSLKTTATPGLFAITLGDAVTAVSHADTLTTTWGSIKRK